MVSSDDTTDPPKAAATTSSSSGSGSEPVLPPKGVSFARSESDSGKGSGSDSKISPRKHFAATSTSSTFITSALTHRNPSRMSVSTDAIIADGDPEKEYLLMKKTQTLNYLTVKILMEQQQHKISALHFDAIHDWCFFFPSVMITLISAILAILVKSTLVPDETRQTVIALFIAVLSVFSTFIQSLMKQFDFSGKAGEHKSCASALRKLFLYTKLDTKEASYNSIYKSLATGDPLSVGADVANGGSDDGSEDSKDTDSSNEKSSKKPPAKKDEDDSEDPPKNDANDAKDEGADKQDAGSGISAQFRQAVDTCNSTVPIEISSSFNIMHSRLELVNKSTMKQKTHAKVDFSIVFPSIYYQLTHTIVQSKGFPIRLLDPERAVDKTLRDWKKHLKSSADNSADLLADLIERSDVIRHLGEKEPLIGSDMLV